MPDDTHEPPIIPTARIVRDRLARVLREAQLLRAQLRVSRRAAEEATRTPGAQRQEDGRGQ